MSALAASLAHRLQEAAAQLLSEVKSLFRASQRTINYFVNGVDRLLDIHLDILKEYFVEKFTRRDGYIEVSELTAALDALRGQSLFAGVKTSSQLDNFIAQKLSVDPEKKLMQIVFNSKLIALKGRPKLVPKEYGYYIPFLPNLEELLKCKDILDCVENPKPAPSGEFKSVTDGLWYRYHEVVIKHGNTVLAIIIYADDVEFADPCKTKVKKHRLRLYYWTLGNIYPELRSTLKAINLLAVTKTTFAKKYGNEPFLKDFIEDIGLLANGVNFKVYGGKEKIFYGILLCCCGDTPQQSNMGGFKESHFAFRPCRFCMVRRDQMCDSFVEDHGLLRTLAQHKEHLKKVYQPTKTSSISPILLETEELEDDVMQVETEDIFNEKENPSTSYGVNGPCCLSMAPGWDETKCYPIDTMHVLNEGCVELLCRLIIKDLVTKPPPDKSKKKQDQPKAIYTLEYINKIIEEMCNFGHLSVNKPSKIEPGHLQKKLKQSAAQIYVLLHFLPFITSKHLPPQKHNLLLQLLKIVDAVMLFHVKEKDISDLEGYIEEFGTNFVAQYPSSKTLKLHSLRHIPMNMRLYGVLRQVWCFRFEAFHRIFTSLVDVVNTMKNIELTMCTRYILRRDTEIALANNRELLTQENQCFGCQSVVLNNLPMNHIELVENLINVGESFTSVNTLQRHSNTWREDVVVMLENNGAASKFAALKKIYLIESEVVFICSALKTEWSKERNAFAITGVTDSLSAIKLSQLSHPYPVTKFTFNFPRSSVSHLLVTRPIEM